MSHVLEESRVGQLQVKVYANRESMGKAAALHTLQLMETLLKKQDRIRMIFAAAPSQNEFLSNLCAAELDWSRVTAFHMDEYVGLPAGHPARFVNYLNHHLFDLVSFGEVHRMHMLDDISEECERYRQVLTAEPVDIVCLGIGENGHIAFNDPGVADFQDPQVIKLVELDEACRLQQVHDGCFPELESVPKTAVTLTIPTLLSARHMVCVVPGESKRAAVSQTLNGPISEMCPASILRTHADCVLFTDQAAYRVK